MSMDAEALPRRSRKGLYIPITLFGLVCAGWGGFWFFARSQTMSIMDAWIAREARLGRVWTCPDRAVGGFPFRIELSCIKPTFASSEPARAGSGSLGGLAVTARAVDPRQVIAVFASPLVWQSPAGETVEIAFENGRAAYRGTPSAMELLSLEFARPSLTVANTSGRQTITSDRTEFHLRRAPGADPATDVALISNGIRSEAFDVLTGDTTPGVIDFRTQVTRYAPAPIRDWRETLENWRRADGEAKIEKLSLTKGALALNLSGVLRLDELRRPEGEISGTAQGINALMRAFGIDMGGGAGGLLGALLGGGRPNNALARALPFSLRFDQGRMYIGPVPGPRLRPLYGP